MGNRMGNSVRLYFLGLQNHCRWWLQPWNSKTLTPWKKSYDQPRQHIKSRDITLPTKVCLAKAMVFPVVMYGCEICTIKKVEHWRIDALNCDVGENSWESLGQQGIKPVNPIGNQPWIFLGRTDAEAEAPVLWPTHEKSWLIGKDFDAGKDSRRRRGQQRMRSLDGITDSVDMNLSNLWEIVEDRGAWQCYSPRVAESDRT